MPVYVYRNLRTGETFEVQQRMTEPALVADPRSGDPVKRLVQPVGIAFKGSGFYVTDSRSSSKGAQKPAKGADGSGAGAGDAPASANGATSDGGAKEKSVPAAPPAKAATTGGAAAD